jgi:hypothetical protein
MTRRGRLSAVWRALCLAAALLVWGGSVGEWAAAGGSLVIEDFTAREPDGFPRGWKTQNNSRGRETYTIRTEGHLAFLSARQADQRVYKRIAWDPKALPVLTWRWRLLSAPAGTDPIAVVYVSLDTDLYFIPVFTKYTWSATRPVGSVVEGGMFSGTEIVVQSGVKPAGEWVEERVNVYEDFKRIHGHEPARESWGISLLAGPGVEVDFGPLVASTP